MRRLRFVAHQKIVEREDWRPMLWVRTEKSVQEKGHEAERQNMTHKDKKNPRMARKPCADFLICHLLDFRLHHAWLWSCHGSFLFWLVHDEALSGEEHACD